MKEIWLPAWIFLTNGRIIEGHISNKSLEAPDGELRMIIPEGYNFPEDKIMPVSDALFEMMATREICEN